MQKKKYFILIIASLYTSLIIYISLMNLDNVPVPKYAGIDKIEHILAYTIEFILWAIFIRPSQKKSHIALSLIIILQGILIEFLQGNTTYRSFEIADMLANGTGAIFGILLYKLSVQKYIETKFSKI